MNIQLILTDTCGDKATVVLRLPSNLGGHRWVKAEVYKPTSITVGDATWSVGKQ